MAHTLFSDPFEYSLQSRPLDQLFDTCLQSLLPLVAQQFQMSCPAEHLGRQSFGASQNEQPASAVVDKDKFQATLDVQHFRPEELTVKVADGVVTVEGKHEEKQDEQGFISRHFVRRYVLPEDHDINKVESKLSSDGVLTITAPKICAQEGCRSIPVIRTNHPIKATEKEDDGKSEK
jgi:crystallin alpha B